MVYVVGRSGKGTGAGTGQEGGVKEKGIIFVCMGIDWEYRDMRGFGGLGGVLAYHAVAQLPLATVHGCFAHSHESGPCL